MGLFPTIHLVLRTLLLGAACIIIQANAGQIPLQNDFNFSKSGINEHILQWDFFEKPSPDSTSHLIFDTVNSFLQHWPNTRYRHGHNVVPGTIPIGTLLYHGTTKQEIPSVPDWIATDPEHSYIFCFDIPDQPGCWLLTLVVTRPLKVLYFDGSSAAKFPGGSMDSQDILAWREVKPEWMFEERKRIEDLCEWGMQYGIDGFVRMEMDFEVMLCDFSAGVEVVSFHNLVPNELVRGRKPKLPIHENENMANIWFPLLYPTGFRVIEAGSWHNFFPGETRIHLNYAAIISFYDIELFPSLKRLRSGKERWDHRLKGISSEDVQTFLKTLGHVLDGAWDRPQSGIDWKTFLRVIVDRYVGRLEVLSRFLNVTTLEPEADITLAFKKVQSHMSGMLSPYRLHSASPPRDIHSIPSNLSWAIPVFQECAMTHTRYIDSNPSLSRNLTYSEHLLLETTKSVSKEICRVIVRMWAEGMEYVVSKEGSTGSAQELVTRWKGLTEELMAWLDWSEWITCRPACGDEEICYLPTWPFYTCETEGSPSPPPPDRFHHLDWHSKSDCRDSELVKPQPKCLRRIDLDPRSR